MQTSYNRQCITNVIAFADDRSNHWTDFHALRYGSNDVFPPTDDPFGVRTMSERHLEKNSPKLG